MPWGGAMNAEGEVRVVKVFVSSPIDVAPERGRVQAVSARLNREYAGFVQLETILWEENFYTADRNFQPQITEAVACDVVMSIFWTRIGSALPTGFPTMPNGKPYPSGTTYELLTALEASKHKGVPDVYVFRKTADATLPTIDSERRRQAQTQLDALEGFWSEWFRSAEGEFKAAFQTFASTDEFEHQVERLLRQWLQSRSVLGPQLDWPKEKGSPFPGLLPFEAEHAAVFFGRDRIIDEARRRLAEATARKVPYLLIVGASGAGKSSLARAGLIPRLTTPGIVPSVDVWRVARMKPGEGQAGPVPSLTTALFAALPELGEGDFPAPTELADHLRRGGGAASRPLVRALARAADNVQRQRNADRPLRPTLLLLIDQLEELFAQGVSDEERAAFAEALQELVATGQVWCVATLRADLYELMLRQPQLKSLKEAGASLDLGPPGPAELAEIVRAPATAAGLDYESDVQKGELDARLLADGSTAESLPLLQFTLRQLYDRREEAGGRVQLTHAAYEAVGGLHGAIAGEAERAVARLPSEALKVLPRLLRHLAEPARDGKTLTLREAPHAELAAKPAEAALVEALVGARILIARTDDAGRSTLRLAHDAVLASWPKAAAAARESSDFYRVRAEVEDALRYWKQHGRPKDRLIASGVPLAEAERLVADFRQELPAEFTAYVDLSRNRGQARQRLVNMAAAFFVALAITATAASILAYQAKQDAVGAEQRANAALVLAQGNELRARENESRALAALSKVAANDGSFTGSVELALAGWPRNSQDSRPRLNVVLDSLALGLSNLVPVVGEYRHEKSVRGARFSRDESRVLSWSDDGAVWLWDIATRRQIGTPKKHDGLVFGAMLNREDTRILSWSEDGTVRLWDVATGNQIGLSMKHDGSVFGALWSRDETRILSWSGDGTVRLWEVAIGRQVGPSMKHGNFVGGARWTRDESRILSWSDDGTVRLWDVATARQIGPPMKHDGQVGGARLTRDESRMLSWSDDGTVRLWDVATGNQIGLSMKHDGSVFGALLSRDETRILSWSKDKVRLWDVATGNQIGLSMKHDGSVYGALLSRDETRILSWTADTVRLWDVATGNQIGPSMKQADSIQDALWSHDETRILLWSDQGTVLLWDLATGRQIGTPMTHDGSVFGALWSRDETRILSWTSDGTVRLWDVAIGRQLGTPMKHDDPVGGVLLTRDETRILSWSWDQTVRLWDVATRRQIGQPMKHDYEVRGALLTSDESRVLSWTTDTVWLWDVATGRQIGAPMKHGYPVEGVLLTRDETRILSWSWEQTVRLWDLATGRQIGTPMKHDGSVRGALLTRDETRILSWSEDGTVRLWDVATGHQIGPSMKHDGSVGRAWLTRDESRVLSWSEDGTVRLWDVATGRQIGPPMKHGGPVRGALLTRDETRILSWSKDGTVRLWDVATARQIGQSMKHDDEVVGALLSRDETRILSWSRDGTARLWDVATSHQIGPLIEYDSSASVESPLLNRDETRIVSWSKDGTVRLWDVSWRGRNLLEIACNYSPPDHDLSAVSTRYGITITDPICQRGEAIPLPDS
jgi:WD40 repeat protein